jgi:hypothetical protein
MPLPKWMDLNTYDRHKLLGELIDAMIYSGEAVEILQATVEQFRLMGYVKSIILPQIFRQFINCFSCFFNIL